MPSVAAKPPRRALPAQYRKIRHVRPWLQFDNQTGEGKGRRPSQRLCKASFLAFSGDQYSKTPVRETGTFSEAQLPLRTTFSHRGFGCPIVLLASASSIT
jgi:hypothetical protein